MSSGIYQVRLASASCCAVHLLWLLKSSPSIFSATLPLECGVKVLSTPEVHVSSQILL